MGLNPEENINLRKKLRVVGTVCLIIGGGFSIVGFISFFSAFGGGGVPSLFWCAFVGLPIGFVGVVCLAYSYLGKFARYVSNEAAPVAKDTINYMVNGTKDSVIGAVKEFTGTSKTSLVCPKCGNKNSITAQFCDECGAPLTKTCPKCGMQNDSDAKFCQKCGYRF